MEPVICHGPTYIVYEYYIMCIWSKYCVLFHVDGVLGLAMHTSTPCNDRESSVYLISQRVSNEVQIVRAILKGKKDLRINT